MEKKCQRRPTLFGLFFFLCSHCYWNFSRISFFYSNQTTQKEEKMSRKVNILPYQEYRPISSFLQLGERIEEKNRNFWHYSYSFCSERHYIWLKHKVFGMKIEWNSLEMIKIAFAQNEEITCSNAKEKMQRKEKKREKTLQITCERHVLRSLFGLIIARMENRYQRDGLPLILMEPQFSKKKNKKQKEKERVGAIKNL